jgi:hypothetical protein
MLAGLAGLRLDDVGSRYAAGLDAISKRTRSCSLALPKTAVAIVCHYKKGTPIGRTWLKPGAWGKQRQGCSDPKRRGFRPTDSAPFSDVGSNRKAMSSSTGKFERSDRFTLARRRSRLGVVRPTMRARGDGVRWRLRASVSHTNSSAPLFWFVTPKP